MCVREEKWKKNKGFSRRGLKMRGNNQESDAWVPDEEWLWRWENGADNRATI